MPDPSFASFLRERRTRLDPAAFGIAGGRRQAADAGSAA